MRCDDALMRARGRRYDEAWLNQSSSGNRRLVLLLVLPFAGAGLVLQTHWWATQLPSVAIWTVGLSLLLGLVVLKLRAATPARRLHGRRHHRQPDVFDRRPSLICRGTRRCSRCWRSPCWHRSPRGSAATGKSTGHGRGTAGRRAAQVAANLGLAALLAGEFVQSWMTDCTGSTPAWRARAHGVRARAGRAG